MDTVDNSPKKPDKQPKPASKTIPGILLRLILVLVAGCLVGAVIYFAASGWVPYLDQRIFQPIDTNQALVQELKATQNALEIQISSLQATVDGNQSEIESDIAATLDQLSEDVVYMQSEVDNNTYFGGTLAPAMIATVSARQDSNSKNLSALATAQMRDSGNRQELELLRTLELLTWAHQYILHDNYGLAENELEAARENLSYMITRVPPKQRVVVLEMLNLVDQCIADLPSRPAVAAEKLQLAWHMGVTEFPYESSYDQGGTVTPTPYITPTTSTSTPTPTTPN
jgi:hypothetical protein